MQTLWL